MLAMRMDYHLNILKVKVSDRQKEFPWFLKQSIVLHNTNCALIRKLNDDRFTFVCHRTESLPVVGAWYVPAISVFVLRCLLTTRRKHSLLTAAPPRAVIADMRSLVFFEEIQK